MPKTITMADIRADPVYSLSVRDLELSPRAANCCIKLNRLYVGEIVQMTDAEFLRPHNTGPGLLKELKSTLARAGLEMDTKISDAPPPLHLRGELKALREQNESRRTELERLADPDRNDLTALQWLEAAKELLTPALVAQIANHRRRFIIQEYLREPFTSFKGLGRLLSMGSNTARMHTEWSLRDLKKVIRANVFPDRSP